MVVSRGNPSYTIRGSGFEMILSKARYNYSCTKCNIELKKGDKCLVKQSYVYGTYRYCIQCVMEEIMGMPTGMR